MPEPSDAIARGVDYLLSLQDPSGRFEDYQLPVGASDQWITAYVGLALLEASEHVPAAAQAGARAAAWLLASRTYNAGFGFNGTTGPDADSTAHAALLCVRAGLAVAPADLAWLSERWRPTGGFATYPTGRGHWSDAHPCVTPVAFAALAACGETSLQGGVIEYLRRQQRPEGSWPAYWWRTHHYADWVALRLLRTLKLDQWVQDIAESSRHEYSFTSVFQLACILGREAILAPDSAAVTELARELCRLQEPTGAWPTGADLRVTDPACAAPWEQPAGKYYVDLRSTITTATCLRVLCDPGVQASGSGVTGAP